MTATVPFFASLVVVFSLPSAAGAIVLPSTQAMEGPGPSVAMMAWMGDSTFPPNGAPASAVDAPPPGAAAARELVFVHPLGDANGDGQADLLLEFFNVRERVARYRALAGPQWSESLWELQGEKDRLVRAVADLDGDGVLDPVIITATDTVNDVSNAGAGPASATTGAIRSTLQFLPLTGTSGVQRFERALPQHLEITTTSAQLAEGVAGSQNRTSALVGQLLPAGRGVFAVFENTWNTTRSTTILPLQPARSTTVEADAVVRLLDLEGNVKAIVALNEPNLNPLEIATNDLLKDNTTQVVALSLAKASQSEELPSGVPRVQLFNENGEPLWTTNLEALSGRPMLVPSLGDVDGDRTIDLGVLEITVGIDLRSVESRFVILSGVDGTVKHVLAEPGSVLAVVPFGPSLDGSGDRLLSIAENQTTRVIRIASLRGSDLTRAWSLPLSPGTVPLNQLVDPLTGNLLGFSDLTGDGIPDVLTSLGGPVGTGMAKGQEFTLYSGEDGRVVWSRYVPGTAIAALLDNAGAASKAATGVGHIATPANTVAPRGASDAPGQMKKLGSEGPGHLVVVTKEGAEADVHRGRDANLSLIMTAYDLATGQSSWRTVLLPQERAALLAADLLNLVTVSALGDVDDDGHVDLALRIEFHLDGLLNATPVARPDGSIFDASGQTVVHTHVVSARAGTVAWSHSDENATGGAARVPLYDLSSEKLEEDGGAAEGGRASGFALPVVIIVVLLAAFLRRRAG